MTTTDPILKSRPWVCPDCQAVDAFKLEPHSVVTGKQGQQSVRWECICRRVYEVPIKP